MSSKQIKIYFNQKNLDFLHIVGGCRDEGADMSTIVNAAIQMAALCSFEKLKISKNELLFCCDILNPGATLTEFIDAETENTIQ